MGPLHKQTRKECDANSDSSVRAANRQNNAQPPSVMAGAEARDEIAAMLLDRDEGGDSLDWYRQFIHENRGTAHLAYSERGRSCVATVTCSRCVCDQALADADKIITALRSAEPRPVLGDKDIAACAGGGLSEINTDQGETITSVLTMLDRYTDSIQGKTGLHCGPLMTNYAMLEAAKIIRLLTGRSEGR